MDLIVAQPPYENSTSPLKASPPFRSSDSQQKKFQLVNKKYLSGSRKTNSNQLHTIIQKLHEIEEKKKSQRSCSQRQLVNNINISSEVSGNYSIKLLNNTSEISYLSTMKD